MIPNAGFPREMDGRLMYLDSPEYFAEYAKQFLEGGISALGGCCGTTPEHIRKMGGSIFSVDTGRKSSAVIIYIDQKETLKDPEPLEKRSRSGHALMNNEWITSVDLFRR